MIRNKGRIRNIYVIAAVAAVPFQSILLIIPNGQRRAVFKIQLVVRAEINRVLVHVGTGRLVREASLLAQIVIQLHSAV